MKKKILSLCVVLALAVTAIIGGTLAYFSDTDNQTNVFTTGNVEIDLWEDFGDNVIDTNNKHIGIEELHPVTYDEDGNQKPDNVIEKEIYVTNKGSEAAYVRVHIAIPAILEDTNADFDANEGVLHFAYEDNAGKDKWNWSNQTGVGNDEYDEYAEKTNKYDREFTIKVGEVDKKIDYHVYVVTYEAALPGTDDGVENPVYDTIDAISTVWMDHKTTNEDITKIKNVLGDEWKIFVAAEGTQAAGFANAYEALNVAFGKPTDAGYISTVDWTTVNDEITFVNND